MNQHHSTLSEILEKKNGDIFFLEKTFFVSIFEKLFTLYTKPKLAKIRPKIEFSQAKWLYHSALGEVLEIKKKVEKKPFSPKFFFFEWGKIIHPLHPIKPKLGSKSNFLGQNDYSFL